MPGGDSTTCPPVTCRAEGRSLWLEVDLGGSPLEFGTASTMRASGFAGGFSCQGAGSSLHPELLGSSCACSRVGDTLPKKMVIESQNVRD